MGHDCAWAENHPVVSMKTMVVGLTGGIGSGKTTVSDYFRALYVPVIDADEIAREITQPNTPAYQHIIKHFGEDILNEDRALNRRQLREIIFSNAAEKSWLEALLHPLIRQEMQKQIQHITSPYCICVIPLLAESTGIEFLDRILVIESSEALQIERTQQRDNSTAQAVENILKTQARASVRRQMAHDIIINDKDLDDLREKVHHLHEKYLKISHGRQH